MKRCFLALTVVVSLLLVVGVGTAAANPPASQGSGQLAGSEQDAGAAAGTAQNEPTNRNVSVRVLSPGDDGAVSQANVAESDATAANANATQQSADQSQGGSGLQTVGQSATSDQDAFALALTTQEGASNENAPVRVLSPGDSGQVSQANVASSDADAGNTNLTGQSADQEQAGSGCCDAGSQVIGQSAHSDQDAAAISATKQEKPSNTNISVRVLSPGDDGPVSQSNVATSDATAANLNATKQAADQTQAAGDLCKCGDSGTQVIGQSAKSDQDAAAISATKQEKPSNTNISVRVLSPGSNGPVSQSNVASSNAAAGNTNVTEQKADQADRGGSCKCGGGTQIIGQSADSDQKAAALSATIQEKPSNENIAVRVLSPGDDGPVEQKNVAASNATAANLNLTKQAAAQAQAGGAGLQVIGQSATNEQDALALALTLQKGASNENAPVRVLSPGDGGPVSQANVATSNAAAGNVNWTSQHAAQLLSGQTSRKGHCCGTAIQAIGQLSKSDQGAVAAALTAQLGVRQPCQCKDGWGSKNDPIRVASKGDDGPVRQLNDASSHAQAGNWKAAKQAGVQIHTAPCVCLAPPSIQALGQADLSSQLGVALAGALQLGAEKKPASHEPVREPERKVMPSANE